MKPLILHLVQLFLDDIDITVSEKNLPPVEEDPVSFCVDYRGDIFQCDARFNYKDKSNVLTVRRQYTRELIEALREALEGLDEE